MPFTNEFDYLTDEIHRIMEGSGLVREDTFNLDNTHTENWYFLDLGDIQPTDESEAGGRTSWKIDMTILVGIVGPAANSSINALKAASTPIMADLMALFEKHRYTERVWSSTGADPYTVRVQDVRLIRNVGVLADTSTSGWAVINGEIPYDRSQTN